MTDTNLGYGQEWVVSKVKEKTQWWVKERKKKLEDQLDETMAINPFMLPFLFDYHGIENLESLAGFLSASHLMTGHATGFGKLIDEKILPYVFGTQKLDTKFRASNPIYKESCFDEIDHVIDYPDGRRALLSLKAGKWTIQLTMAVQLNKAFSEILARHSQKFDEIVVGVFYGRDESLTDKYKILRGINTGANHDVADVTRHVQVLAGREFWSWLNSGQADTQEWVLEGILEALKTEEIRNSADDLLRKFRTGVALKYKDEMSGDHNLDWFKLLKKING